MNFAQPIISITDDFIEIKIPKRDLEQPKTELSKLKLNQNKAEEIWKFMRKISQTGEKIDLIDYLRQDRNFHF